MPETRNKKENYVAEEISMPTPLSLSRTESEVSEKTPENQNEKENYVTEEISMTTPLFLSHTESELSQ